MSNTHTNAAIAAAQQAAATQPAAPAHPQPVAPAAPQPAAQPAPVLPTEAAPQLSILAVYRDQSIVDSKVVKTIILASDNNEYELLTEFNVMQDNPALWQRLQFAAEQRTDKSGRPYVNRYCYASGYEKYKRKALAIPGVTA